jgi:hypothetical protein
MTEKHKAYCGDAIAQLVVGELRGEGIKVRGVLSNRVMTFAYCKMNDIEFQKKFSTSKELKAYYKNYGTKFEAMLYDVFKSEGYESVRNIIEENLIPFKK